MNGKQEESTVVCVAMVYLYFEARGRTFFCSRSKETTLLRAKNTGVTSNALLIYY